MSRLIRRLNPGEFALYKQVRLASLRESPEAFATTLESALAREDASWVKQADTAASGPDRAIFVMLADEPAGLAALYRDPERSGEGELLQVWVAPSLRGSGAAVELMDAVFAWASLQGISTIRAEVTRDNTRALNFYRRLGFKEFPGGAPSADQGHVLIRKCPDAQD